MKHVFRVSSHLTFFLSKKYIEVKGLNLDDCIIFLVRDYHIPTKYDAMFKHQIHTSYNVSQTVGRVFAGANIFKTRQNIAEFDGLVDPYINGDSFIWYAQICNDDFCSLMVTKKNCVGYYVIEDGLGSYIPKNPQTFVGWRYLMYKFLLKPLWPRIFEVKNNFIYTDSPKFKGCIATSQKCFPLYQQYLEVMEAPFEKQELDVVPEAVVSIDPLYLYMDDVTVKKVYNDLGRYIAQKNYKTVHYKYHPYLNSKANASIKADYKKMIDEMFGDKGIELSADVVLENLFCTYKCDFYTNRSSVAVYASNMGSTCYSYSPIIQKYKSDYTEFSIVDEYCTPIVI